MGYTKLVSLCSILLLGYVFLSGTVARNIKDDGDWNTCADGSDLINPPECPPQDGQAPVYFPFPGDCTQYFECTNGIARCLKCAPGTVWDQANTICNHPAVVDCPAE